MPSDSAPSHEKDQKACRQVKVHCRFLYFLFSLETNGISKCQTRAFLVKTKTGYTAKIYRPPPKKKKNQYILHTNILL